MHGKKHLRSLFQYQLHWRLCRQENYHQKVIMMSFFGGGPSAAPQ
jgi:hypothetical protein